MVIAKGAKARPGEPVFFASPEELRAWLAEHHATENELVVGLWKKGTTRGTWGWKELVDECLCYGWIDGRSKSIDDERWCIRITPRKKRSHWSAVNLANVARLEKEGRMTAAGRAAFEARTEERSRVYSFEQAKVALDPAREKAFRAKKRAWTFWQEQPPSYRKVATWWVESAKKEETKARRLASLVEHSARGERLPPFVSPARPKKARRS